MGQQRGLRSIWLDSRDGEPQLIPPGRYDTGRTTPASGGDPCPAMDVPRGMAPIDLHLPDGASPLQAALEPIEALSKTFGGTVASFDLTDAEHGEFVIRIAVDQALKDRNVADQAS